MNFRLFVPRSSSFKNKKNRKFSFKMISLRTSLRCLALAMMIFVILDYYCAEAGKTKKELLKVLLMSLLAKKKKIIPLPIPLPIPLMLVSVSVHWF